MKKFILAACIAVAGCVCASAQQSQAVGVNLGYGSEIETFSIGVKYQHGITDAIRGEVAFNYFFENQGLSMWDIDVTGHYLFNVAEKVKVYPLAGLTYTNVKVDWGFGSASDGKLGVNLGGGAEYALTETISIGAELKYSLISDWDQILLQIGATYKF